MLIRFFEHIRSHRVPVSLREFLDLHSALRARLVFANLGQFYYLARLCLVKDEQYFDRFDVAFEAFFNLQTSLSLVEITADMELLTLLETLPRQIAEQWLAELDPGVLGTDGVAAGNAADPVESETEDAPWEDPWERNIPNTADDDEPGEAPGDEDDESLAPGDGDGDGDGDGGEGNGGDRGQGDTGSEGEGTGQDGDGGIRTEPEEAGSLTASRIWQQRQFRDYDPDVELGTRNIRMALRRLRKFARESAELMLDLPETISRTARNGGFLDIVEVPERHNAVKVLLFLDVGGSMDAHVEACASLFTAARSEFKYLEYFYFHNFLYESVWEDNHRRQEERVTTVDLIRTYASDYKVIFVGDAQMGLHEIRDIGGSVEHYNREPGEQSLARLTEHFRHVIWLNPVQKSLWQDSLSIATVNRLVDQKMFQLSSDGIASAMRELAR